MNGMNGMNGMNEFYGIILVDQLHEKNNQGIWPLAEIGSFQFLDTIDTLNELIKNGTFSRREYSANLLDKFPYTRTYKIVSRSPTQERKGAIYKLKKNTW